MLSLEEVSSSNFYSHHTSRLSLDWQRRESLYFEVPTHDKSYLILQSFVCGQQGAITSLLSEFTLFKVCL